MSIGPYSDGSCKIEESKKVKIKKNSGLYDKKVPENRYFLII